MSIRGGALGLATGLAAAVFIHTVLLQALDVPFTFRAFGILHREHPLLLLADLLPLVALAAGMLAGTWLHRKLHRLAMEIRRDRERNEQISRFAHSLTGGSPDAAQKIPLEEHPLADALKQLQNTLDRNRRQERQRRLEERQRNWVSEGLADFGDILRTQSADLETLAYAVISRLVRYLDANQGAIFLTGEDEIGGGEGDGTGKYLEMVACHAYGRRKFPDRRIPWGEGLIGAVAMEKKGYYTDKIPQGYLTITSGVGKASPTHLLIEPLLWNEKVFGIIELASFKELEEYKIQFVGRVAENVATTIHTMESSLRTQQLLKETQAQADQLARQEEKVRQNMEALQHAQKEAADQAEIFIRFTNTVNHTLMRAEYDTSGRLLYANTRFLKKLGYAGNREVEGKPISMFIHAKDRPWFEELWERLASGGRHFEGYMKHETKMGQDLWTMATYTCMRREDGSVEKILFLATDATEQKKQSLEYEGQIAAIDRINARSVFTPGGKLHLSNHLFGKLLKYTEMELEQMNVFDFFGRNDQERFNEIWENVIRGEPYQGQLKLLSKYEEEVWFRATLLSADDIYGEVEKVIFLGSEITKEKEMELSTRRQHDQLVRKEEELRLASLDLKKELEETSRLRQEDTRRWKEQISRYDSILDALPFAVISINNLGFVRFMNRGAESLLGVRKKEALDRKAGLLFGPESSSELIRNFVEPSGSKKPGTYSGEEFSLPDGRKIRKDLRLIKTDLDAEVCYTLMLI